MCYPKGKYDRALEYAERCPLVLFDMDSSDTSLDPNLLYWYVIWQYPSIFGFFNCMVSRRHWPLD
jgi:hypothetical protein